MSKTLLVPFLIKVTRCVFCEAVALKLFYKHLLENAIGVYKRGVYTAENVDSVIAKKRGRSALSDGIALLYNITYFYADVGKSAIPNAKPDSVVDNDVVSEERGISRDANSSDRSALDRCSADFGRRVGVG